MNRKWLVQGLRRALSGRGWGVDPMRPILSTHDSENAARVWTRKYLGGDAKVERGAYAYGEIHSRNGIAVEIVESV